MGRQTTRRALWPAVVGTTALVATAALVSVGNPAEAIVTATATPSSGAAGAIISINAPANTFRSGTTLNVANTNGAIDANAVQFVTGACPTTAQAIPAVSRSVSDGVIATSTSLVSATANFVSSDVGRVVAGTGIAPGTTISTVTNATTVVLSTATTASASSVTVLIGARRVTDLVTTNGSKNISSASAAFSPADIGSTVYSTNVATTIASVTSPTTAVLTANASGTGTAQTATIGTLSAPYGLPGSSVTVVSSSKLVITAPASMQSVPAGTQYNICVWDDGDGAAANTLTTAPYKVYAAPTITSVTSTSGPSLGGGSITIRGTNLTAATTVKIGGVALVNPTVSTANQTITGLVPSNAPGNANIVLSNEGGSVTYTESNVVKPYVYYDAISVSPNSVTSTGSTILDIYGGGLDQFVFTVSGDDHIMLVQGTADPTNTTPTKLFDVGANAGAANSKAAECTNVVALSETEVICTLNAGASASTNPAAISTSPATTRLPEGSYQVVIVDDDDTAPTRQTIITSGSAFTVAPF